MFQIGMIRSTTGARQNQSFLTNLITSTGKLGKQQELLLYLSFLLHRHQVIHIA